jgi:4-amino-4-deoxy-L-arabinose transferase-like glycosyltransferase
MSSQRAPAPARQRGDLGAVVALVLLCLAFLLPGLTSLPPTDRDESRFAQATRQMVQSGDYLDIRFQDEPRHRKPGGIYWLQALALRLTGMESEDEIWPYRLPSLLAAIAAVLMTYATGRLLFSRMVAFLGAALLGSSLLLVVEAHLATSDAVMLATVVGMQWCLARLYTSGAGRNRGDWIMVSSFWLVLGGSVLVKGPVGPVIVLLSIIALQFLDPGSRVFRRLKPWAGLPVAVAVVLPWAWAVSAATGGGFLARAVGTDLLPKLISGQEGHGAWPGTYLALLPLTFWPGSVLLGTALAAAWRDRRRPAVLFCAAWILPAWILFELIPTKLPHYVLPLYPALALLAARGLLGRWGPTERDLAGSGPTGSSAGLNPLLEVPAIILFGAVTLVYGATAVLLPRALEGTIHPVAWVIAAAAIVVAAAGLPAHRSTRALATVLAGAAIMIGLWAGWILPETGALWPSRSARDLVLTHADPDQPRPVVVTGFEEPSLVFLLGTDTVFGSPQDAVLRLATGESGLALVADPEVERFLKSADVNELELHLHGLTHGLNVSKGNWVILSLYGVGAGSRRE